MPKINKIRLQDQSGNFGNAIPIEIDAEHVYINSQTLSQKLDQIDQITQIDKTLNLSNKPADAKTVGNAINSINARIPVIDANLSQQGKVADAKAVGDAINSINTNLDNLSSQVDNIDIPTVPNIDTTLTISGATADAKTVGDNITAINGNINTINGNINILQKNVRLHSLAEFTPNGAALSSENFTAAWQNAMNNNNVHGIFIPFGEYTITQQLNLTYSSDGGSTFTYKKENFIIDGMGSTIIKKVEYNNSNMFHLWKNSNCVIKNLTLNMNQDISHNTGSGFQLRNCNNIVLENIDIINIGGIGCLAYTDSDEDPNGTNIHKNLIFRNIKMRGTRSVDHPYGEGYANNSRATGSERPCGIIATNCKNSIIENCEIYNMNRFGIEFKNFSKNCYIRNNIIMDCAFGINIEGDNEAVEQNNTEKLQNLSFNIFISNNNILGTLIPLHLARSAQTLVTNNYFSSGSTQVRGLTNCLFSNNIFKTTSTDDFDFAVTTDGSVRTWHRTAGIQVRVATNKTNNAYRECKNVYFLNNIYICYSNLTKYSIPSVNVTIDGNSQTISSQNIFINGYHDGIIIDNTSSSS